MEKYTKKRTLTWKSFWPLLVIVLIAGILKVKAHFSHPVAPTADVPSITHEEVVDQPVTQPVPELTPTPTTEPTPTPAIPGQFNLAVPFSSQAPFMVWDAYHEEACEEASMLMVMEFYRGTKTETLDPQFSDDQYHKMTDLEDSLGYGLSMTAAETVDTIQKYSEFKATVVDNPTVDQLKEFVLKGEPVIIPAAGRKLGNPFFTGIGPLYHMLVIRGYTKDGKFITNDPGTRHGENYSYDPNVLMNAIGDWNNGDPEHGAKRVVVIETK